MADITSRRMGVFSRMKLDVPSERVSTNRSLGSLACEEPACLAGCVLPVCDGQDSDELFGEPILVRPPVQARRSLAQGNLKMLKKKKRKLWQAT